MATTFFIHILLTLTVMVMLPIPYESGAWGGIFNVFLFSAVITAIPTWIFYFLFSSYLLR